MPANLERSAIGTQHCIRARHELNQITRRAVAAISALDESSDACLELGAHFQGAICPWIGMELLDTSGNAAGSFVDVNDLRKNTLTRICELLTRRETGDPGRFGNQDQNFLFSMPTVQTIHRDFLNLNLDDLASLKHTASAEHTLIELSIRPVNE
jgi:hypothetical protein